VYELTQDLLKQVTQLKPKDRKKVMEFIGKTEYERCAADIFYWLDPARHGGIHYVYTNERHPQHKCLLCEGDPQWSTLMYHFNKRRDHLRLHHDMEVSSVIELNQYYKELPGTRPFTIFPYMPPIIEAWLEHPMMVIEKSRDMMATWLIVTCYTWDTLFHTNRENIFQSEDATKTWELIERAIFIHKSQPKFLRDVYPIEAGKGENKSGTIRIPAIDSALRGFPQGADQIRQYHPSGFFSDEAAFQSAAGDSFSAIKPAIQAGGRYTAVSSANPSFFMHIAQDTIHTVTDYS
jgi:hypothetical protein